MSQPTNASPLLKLFAQILKKVPDPRSKKGQSYPLNTLLALTFLGLIANCTNAAELARWSKNHLKKLRPFLRFRRLKGKWRAPVNLTFSRLFEVLSLEDLQNAFAEFINLLLADTSIIAAVDGKAAKQMKNENGDPLLMLNVFAQQLKLHLASWDVRGDKTNEPNCLKKHLRDLFTMYPSLKLLTGDAIFAQRPLLEAIREYERDYLFQVKENQPKVLRKMEEVFKDAELQEPDDTIEIVEDTTPKKKSPKLQDRKVAKKRGLLRFAACG
jgi:hypothetical protein